MAEPNTSVPALTTTFKPAPSCLESFWMVPFTQSGYTCGPKTATLPCAYLHLGPSETAGCQPSGYAPETTHFFSPGVCPSGYSQASSTIVTAGTVTETQGVCCPSKYTLQRGTLFPWVSTNKCAYAAPATTPYTFLSSSNNAVATSTWTDKYTANAYAVNVRYQSTDFGIIGTSSSTSTASSGLSTGAQAGIGVGVGVGGLIFITFGILYFLVRRRRSRAGKLGLSSTPLESPALDSKSILPPPQYETSQPINNNQQYALSELGSSQQRGASELAGTQLYEAGGYSDNPQSTNHPRQEAVELGPSRE